MKKMISVGIMALMLVGSVIAYTDVLFPPQFPNQAWYGITAGSGVLVADATGSPGSNSATMFNMSVVAGGSETFNYDQNGHGAKMVQQTYFKYHVNEAAGTAHFDQYLLDSALQVNSVGSSTGTVTFENNVYDVVFTATDLTITYQTAPVMVLPLVNNVADFRYGPYLLKFTVDPVLGTFTADQLLYIGQYDS